MEQERSLEENREIIVGDGCRLSFNYDLNGGEDIQIIELDEDKFGRGRNKNTDDSDVFYVTPDDHLGFLFGMKFKKGQRFEYPGQGGGNEEVIIEDIEVRKSK